MIVTRQHWHIGARSKGRARLLLAVVLVVFVLGAARANDATVAPLDGKSGDASRGRTVVLDRQTGNCLICHSVPKEPDELFQGDIGPSLTGVGSRLNTAQLRFRLIDQSRLNPNTVMPPYYRIEGLVRVPARFAGKPALDAQQIEDVIAYLATLKE